MALDNSSITGNKTGVDNSILAKLAKINELQKGATTEGEALTAAKMLQALLIKHKLEMTDIEAVELNRDEPVEKEYLEGSEYGFKVQRRVAWTEHLAKVVADAHFCKIMVVPGSNTVVFVGRKSDRDVAKRIFIYLAAAARELVEKDAKEYMRTFTAQFDWEKPDIRGFKASWLSGFVSKIAERYALQRREIEAAAKLAAEGEARARREVDIDNEVLARGADIEQRVLDMIDDGATADIDILLESARQAVDVQVRAQFQSIPLDINPPLGLVRLKTAEQAVENWFTVERRGRRVGTAKGVSGYRRTHSSAGYTRGQTQGSGVSMSGNVLR